MRLVRAGSRARRFGGHDSPRPPRRRRPPHVHVGVCLSATDARVVSSGDQVVGEDDLDKSDDGADDHAEQSVQEEGRHERVLEDLGVVDRVQHRLFDLQRQR